jgi:hypothetical protein
MTDLPAIFLARGSHPQQDCADPQRCLFEWYNVLARDVHTDDCPPGVSRVLHRYGMRLNDLLPDAERQQLVAYLPNGASPLAGTATDGKDYTRGMIAADWGIRTALPYWLDAAGMNADASALRGLPPVATREIAVESQRMIKAIRGRCAAPGGAAADTAYSAYSAAAAAASAAADAADAAADADAADADAYAYAAYDAAYDDAAADIDAADAAAYAADAAAYAAAASAAAAAADAAAADAAAYASASAAVVSPLIVSAVDLYAVLVAGEWPAS